MPEPLQLERDVARWLNDVDISLVSDWDVLVFLYRHGSSLSSAENISTLLGYAKSAVGKALDSLVTLGLVQRSRSSQGVRLYNYSLPSEAVRQQSLEALLDLSRERNGRLMITTTLGLRAQSLKPQLRGGLKLA